MDKKQQQMKEQIKDYMRKKDYYDILGLQKTATLEQIKKSYKKLALRFHPDKNGVQGAKQVFKKVSNAYTVLSNTQQRERYDRFGPQQQQQVRYRQQRRNYNNGDQQFDEFDELFRAFFGGGFGQNVRMNGNGGNFRTYTYNFGGGHAHAQNPQHQRQGPLFKSKPYYSFSANTQYRFKVSTDLLGTPYFVRQQFFTQAKNPAFKKQIDLKVDYQYMVELSNKCDLSTRTKKRYQYQAYQYNPGEYRNYYLGEANRVDMSPCKKIRDLQSNYPQYMSQVFSY